MNGFPVKVKIEACPLCHAKSFFVEYDELLDAEGFIECEFDGTMLKSADPDVSDQIIDNLRLSVQAKDDFLIGGDDDEQAQ